MEISPVEYTKEEEEEKYQERLNEWLEATK